MNMYPDLEVYLPTQNVDTVIEWLQAHFQGVDIKCQNPKKAELRIDDQMDVLVLVGAVESRYITLWFKQNKTPWPTDVALAKALAQSLGLSVRCSPGGWSEAEDAKAQSADDWIEVAPDHSINHIQWPQA